MANQNYSIPQKFDDFLDAIQSMLMSFLVKLGPFAVALMPALFTAYAIFHTFAGEAGAGLALVFAATVGLAMETVGIVATHTAIDLYNAKEGETIQPGKFRLMVWLVPVYVAGVAAVVYFSENAFTPLVKGLGVASPFLTCIVYIAVALARDIRQTEAKLSQMEDKQDDKEMRDIEWQREKERMEMELKHKERLARIEAKKAASNPQATRNDAANNPQFGQIAPPLRTPKEDWRIRAAEVLRENPQISGAELGRLIGASERTGQNILAELKGKVNGNGVSK